VVDFCDFLSIFTVSFLTVIQWESAVFDAVTSLRICLPQEGNLLSVH